MSDPTITPPTQEQVAAMGPVIDAIVIGLKWLGFSAAAGWVMFKFTVRSSLKVGEEKHKYETLRTDVDVLKEQSNGWLSVPAPNHLKSMRCRMPKIETGAKNR